MNSLVFNYHSVPMLVYLIYCTGSSCGERVDLTLIKQDEVKIYI